MAYSIIKLVASVSFLFVGFEIGLVRPEEQGNRRSSKSYAQTASHHSQPKFVSFDSEGGHINIDWDVSIPFISIPLKHHRENGEPSPLLNVNTKALGMVGLITTVLSLAAPLFSKPEPVGPNYRSIQDRWLDVGSMLNEVVFGNSYVAPCMQRVICSTVQASMKTPTSSAKIIDGLSSHKWFKEATNGTIIEDAVKIGRQGHNGDQCAQSFKDCQARPKFLESIVTQLGLV